MPPAGLLAIVAVGLVLAYVLPQRIRERSDYALVRVEDRYSADMRVERASAARVAPRDASSEAEATPARCPMSVPGTSLSAADAGRGEALTFTTVGQVAALQDRVQAMAELHNLRQRRGRVQHGAAVKAVVKAAWSERATRWSGASMPPSYATVLEVERGAVLTITSDAPDDIEQLRYALRMRAWQLQHLGCATAPATHG